jgi:predicted NBD/HSP70 family sugar kinase
MKQQLLIGLDIGGSKILGLLYDHQKKMVYASQRQPIIKDNLAALVQQLTQEIKRLTAEAETMNAEVLGAGLGIPGLINQQKIITCPNLSILNGQKLTNLLLKKTQLKKIVLDNDLNCFLSAHLEKYPALKNSTLAVIALGTGIGGSIAINGKNIISSLGISSEIGHMIIDPKTNHSLEYYYHKIMNYPTGRLFSTALAGNPVAQKKAEQFARIFGLAMVNLNNLINPQTIILTGGIAHYHKTYLPLVKKIVKDYSFTNNRPQWRIGRDQKIAAIGASLLAK